jgi:hypothetical protein
MICIFGQGQAQAAELDPSNLVGEYKVQADLGFQKYYLNFHVINTQEFEMQRTYPNGQVDEICNGTYNMNSQLLWTFTALTTSHVFKGRGSCPSNRSHQVDFNIDFKNKTTEDLVNGTTVAITTSLAPGYVINSYFKRK